MTSYNKTTDFASKDALPSGDPNKIIRGSDIGAEFDNIETAVNSKADASAPTLTGNATAVNLSVSGTLNSTGDLQIDGTTITATAAELNLLDGVTSTTAELNILDGVTATTAEINKLDGLTATTVELNYVDGVTSNIQTQLNDKLESVAFNDLTSTPTTLTGYGITDAATSAQGDLADTSVQPGDDADTLGSGTATDGYVLTADGAGGAAWEESSGGIQDGDTVSSLDIDGGTIDSTVIGGSSAAAGTFTEVTTAKLSVGAEIEWNSGTDTYIARTTSGVTSVHENMKRCVLNDDGTVNYYLDPTDSTLKADGTAANLDGTDGNVMVEIPKFYYRFTYAGIRRKWEVAEGPTAGFILHPAFIKNGVEVDHRYIGAYDACVYDDSAGAYVSGTNLDDMTSNIDFSNDKLASVSGVYPIIGLTRDECRTLAANIGAGWRQHDFWLIQAIQILYLVEYGDFNSQANLGDGNVNGSYISASSSQSDSPHTVAGASNSWGNASTDGTQPSGGAKPGTAYMSYRGIENFFGNAWNWVDGFNINDRQAYVSNTDTDFDDDTTTNYDELGAAMPSSNEYITDIQEVSGAFLPDSVGGSSSTYLTDYYYQSTGGWRVARFGGNASIGGSAGLFCWSLNDTLANAGRSLGARVAF